jgi:hypothetical protein
MFRSAILVLFCFLLGMAIPVSLSAHSLLTSPLPMSAAPSSEAQTIDAALGVCSLVNATRSVPDCKVFHRNKSVSFTLRVNATEAAKVCASTAKEAARTGAFTGKGWAIRIYSGYAVEPIAFCHLG